MSFRHKARSGLLRLLFGPAAQASRRRWYELQRRLTGRRHTVQVFLELDDPYSYLLSLHVPDLRRRYDIDVQVHLTQALGDGYRPRADLLAVYGQEDCQRVAAELGVPFLDRGAAPPVEHRRALINALATAEAAAFENEVLEAIALYWRGDAESIARRIGSAQGNEVGEKLLRRSQKQLQKLGHYNSATLYYAGEWFWGVDRLHYLARRLDALRLRQADAPPSKLATVQQVEKVSLPISRPASAGELPPLEFFFSFRSPYSYLAIRRVFAIADAFGLRLQIRPVLPMVMRGMQVPAAKLRYIAADTFREAERLAIPFGKFADPLGAGVERCLATFYYASGEKKEREFVLNAATAIWSEATDVATDKGLRKITGRTGLFWPDVKNAIASDEWRDIVEENRASMTASGSWGVPTFRLGDFTVWGQDRIWLLLRHIEEQCDTGEGIMI